MKYINDYGTIIEIVKKDNYITYKINNTYRCVSQDSFDNIIRLNNYKEI